MRNDTELMAAVSRGDMDAFTEIVTRHQHYVWKLAYRFNGDYHEAEDVACETFLRVLEAAPRYRPVGEFCAYLRVVATRLCLDRAKKKCPLYSDQIPESTSPDPSPNETYEWQQRASIVRLALGRLTPGQRMAVILCYYQELNHAQVATAMDTTIKAVERLLARARQNLKLELNKCLREDASQTGGFALLARLYK